MGMRDWVAGAAAMARGLSRLGKAAATTQTSYTLKDAEFAKLFGNVSSSGKVVNESNMMGISAAWACCRILSETIGSLPWGIYKREGDNAVRADDHPLSRVLVGSPNADMTSAEYREAKVLNLCQAGNAYSLKETLAGDVSSLTPIPSTQVQPKQKLGGNTKLALRDGQVFYSVQDRGKWEDYPREKIWHVKGFGPSGLVGLSPLAAAREAMGMALAVEEFGNRFFSQGGKPSGVVTIEKFLTKEQRAIARENMQQMLGGLANAHKFALFEGGMKPEPWGEMSLEDMLFILVRKFNVNEICRFYRVPPHMVADLDKATFSNIEHLSLEFVQFTLMPYLTRFESSVSKWLLSPEDRGKFFLRFNYEGLLRADSKGRAEFYASALQNGWMTRNEVRALENRNSVKGQGMDDYTVQTNLAPVEDLGKVVDKGKKPPAAAEPDDKSAPAPALLN